MNKVTYISELHKEANTKMLHASVAAKGPNHFSFSYSNHFIVDKATNEIRSQLNLICQSVLIVQNVLARIYINPRIDVYKIAQRSMLTDIIMLLWSYRQIISQSGRISCK